MSSALQVQGLSLKNFMHSQNEDKESVAALTLRQEVREWLQETAEKLRGSDRRIFMAKAVQFLGKGGQRAAERELGWNRNTIRKGELELAHGPIQDNFSARGRKRIEEHLPHLLEDIQDIIDNTRQGKQFASENSPSRRITASVIRQRLIKEKGYLQTEVPAERTLRNKLKELGYTPERGQKGGAQKTPGRLGSGQKKSRSK